MKRLLLLRHAKAVAKNAADFERVLAPRGRADMAAVARYLAAERLAPEVALVSSAARTRETWSLAGLDAVPARFDRRIYEAERSDLLDILRSVEDEAGSAILVGHNPAIEELAQAMLGDPGPLRPGFPTAALAVIDLPAAAWRELAPGSGRLDRFVTPATLGAGADA